MKKWFAMLLCALLCLPLLAVAEDAQYEWYDDPAGRFSFAYPATWTVVSRENMEATMDEAAKLDDEDFLAALENVRDSVLVSDMVMVMSDNLTTNINMIPQEVGMEATDEVLLELGAQLQTMLAQQAPNIEYPRDPYLIDLGNGSKALAVEYTWTVAGFEIYGVQTMHTRGTTLYTITLTSDPENVQADSEVLGLVLGSLTVE